MNMYSEMEHFMSESEHKESTTNECARKHLDVSETMIRNHQTQTFWIDLVTYLSGLWQDSILSLESSPPDRFMGCLSNILL